jgi:hypothetical protein
MARAFDANVAPLARQSSTRVQLWKHWRGILTIAVAHGVVDKLVPMANETLSALSWQLILLGCSASHIGQAWGAIAHRHAVARVPTPFAGKGDYAKGRKSLGVMQGQPSPLKFPIWKEHLRVLLALPGLATAPFVVQRNILGTALTVVCGARVSEMAELQSCDVLFNFDVLRGTPGFEGTAAIKIRKRKNNVLRKGLFPRIGKALQEDTAFDLVAWLRSFLQQFDLVPHPECRRELLRPRSVPPVFAKALRRGTVT